MKRNMKVCLFASALVLTGLIVGCESMVGREVEVNASLSSFKAAAPALDPFTGGMATPIAGILGILASSAFAVNRLLLAKRLGDAIKEINANPETPSVLDQVLSDTARKVVISLVIGSDKSG